MDLWELFPTRMEQTLLKLIRLAIAKRCELHGKVVRWQRAEANRVEREELSKYAEDLAADLRQAEAANLIPIGYFNQGSPTEPEEGNSPQERRIVVPVILDDEDSENVDDIGLVCEQNGSERSNHEGDNEDEVGSDQGAEDENWVTDSDQLEDFEEAFEGNSENEEHEVSEASGADIVEIITEYGI